MITFKTYFNSLFICIVFSFFYRKYVNPLFIRGSELFVKTFLKLNLSFNLIRKKCVQLYVLHCVFTGPVPSIHSSNVP